MTALATGPSTMRGMRPRLPTRRDHEALTPAEQEVACLVAAGLRNAEIGVRLCISTRTVECHLTRIYQKRGIRSRTELAIATGARTTVAERIGRCWRCHANLDSTPSIA